MALNGIQYITMWLQDKCNLITQQMSYTSIETRGEESKKWDTDNGQYSIYKG